ncbi:MAG: peptidylprolyl isomerase [Deltaproteobacteria bacterium]|nr:peptidylprolyl isomerase [Deltaproteobacteria bacterium]
MQRCLTLPTNNSPIVAQIGESFLTTEDILRRLHQQGSTANRYTNTKSMQRFVEDQIRLELLANAAIEQGLDRDPEVIEAAQKVMVRKLLLQDLGLKALGDQISDKAVKDYYDNHIDQYIQPEKIRLAHVELDPTPEGRALAQSLIDKLKGAERSKLTRTLAKLAQQYSRDRTSKTRGGEIGFVSKSEVEQNYGSHFSDEVFKLQVEEITAKPVQSTHGWHVVLAMAKKTSSAYRIEDVADDIRSRLLTKNRSQIFEQYLKDLKNRYPTTIHNNRISELVTKLRNDKLED